MPNLSNRDPYNHPNRIFDGNSGNFYEVPVVNIDHHAENDNFGQLNIVDITASATSEVLADLLQKIGENNPVCPIFAHTSTRKPGCGTEYW